MNFCSLSFIVCNCFYKVQLGFGWTNGLILDFFDMYYNRLISKELAFHIAERRVRGCYLNFLSKGHMFEKYDAISITKIGGGGEYEVQLGFGWTNGVILDFLDMYCNRLTSKELNSSQMD